ncbi:MAG: amidohydrolase [Eubacteriales bacterium]|nr:amidohydrolase [Eubacteriales bacterium]
MKNKKILLKNAYILSMSPGGTVYEDGHVLIEGDTIIDVGHFDLDKTLAVDEVLDLKGKYVLPGLINTHVHTSQQISRGVGDDVKFETWLHDRMWPFESNLNFEDSYVSTLLCCLELIKSGVTSFAEAGGQYVDAMAKAVTETGLRAKLSKSVMDTGVGLPDNWQLTADQELAAQVELYEKFNNTADGRIDVWFGLRTLFNNSEDLILRTKELADKYNTGIHMHVAEAKSEVEYAVEKYGMQTVSFLNKLGVLDKNLLAVHSVWLDDDEIDMYVDHDVKVSHNPASAMRVLGFAKIPKMLEKGVCVTIGTDGASSSNRMDIVDEMWLTSIIHKGWRLDPTVVKAEEILRMVTSDGARALLSEDQFGSLEKGKKADLIIINPNDPSMMPVNDKIAALVTAMHSTNITHTMCDGKWLMKDRQVLTINEEEVLAEAQVRADAVYKRAGITLRERFPVERPVVSNI